MSSVFENEFRASATKLTVDLRHRALIRGSLKGYEKNRDEKRAFTLCDALIAQTGSILLTARSAGGRALSVLPPHHIVIAQGSQLLPDLPAAFELLQRTYNGDYPSLITFITGPSRTSDIERILVLGAHGPRFLTIFFLPNET
jgi:L-lactate dehydrogenase complex protein LldG